ncbi:MAG: tetratricopeptide repeat protein [Deltaproteobacteria bacterium]|nr:tetratricopeptide repeat protein [Deltaproteobacteria bacterium]
MTAAANDARAEARLGVVVKGPRVNPAYVERTQACLAKVLDGNMAYPGRVLEEIEKSDVASLRKFARKNDVHTVMLLELMPGQGYEKTVLVQRIGLEGGDEATLSTLVDGKFGDTCDWAFILMVRHMVDHMSETAKQAMQIGDGLRDQGLVDEAIARYQQAANIDLNSARPYMRISDIYRGRGEIQTAMEWAQKSLELNPRDPDPYLAVGEMAMQADRRETAMDYYQHAISIGLRIPVLYETLGRLQVWSRMDAIGAQNLKDALALNPYNYNVYPPLIDALEREEHYNEAVDYLLEYNKTYPSKEAEYRVVSLLERAEEYERAIPTLTKMVADEPGKMELREKLAHAQEMSGRLDDALQTYAAILQADPMHVDANRGAGRISYRRKQYANAIVYLQTARANDPYDSEAIRLEGTARELTGDIDGALENYADALMRDKQVQAINVRRFLILAKKHDRLTYAINLVQSALDYKQLPARRTLVMALGQHLVNEGATDDAIMLYEAALPRLGDFAPPSLALGELYLKKGDIRQADENFRRAILLTGDARSPYFAGLKFKDLGRYEDARFYLRLAWGRDDSNPAVMIALAETLFWTGEFGDLAFLFAQGEKLSVTPAQEEMLTFMRIVWGCKDGQEAYARQLWGYWQPRLEERGGGSLDLSDWEPWIANNFAGNQLAFIQSVAKEFSAKASGAPKG